ncbi:uncharacterized protein LOC111118419 isoform X2 [Crassostrea virginica]
MIKYNLHCGTQEVYCEWPLQYCFDNEVCRYCSTDVCHNPPDQCKYMCEYFKLQDPSYKENQRNTTCEDLEHRKVCFEKMSFIFGCIDIAGILVCMITGILLSLRTKTIFSQHSIHCFSFPRKHKQRTICATDITEMTSMCVPSGN